MLHVGSAPLDHLAVAHHTLRVNDHNRAPAVAFVLAPKPLGLRHLAFGVKVRQEREIQPPQLLREGLVRVNAVDADAQNLGI